MNWDYVPIGENYSYSLWTQPDDLIDRLTLHPQRQDHRGNLGVGGPPGHDLGALLRVQGALPGVSQAIWRQRLDRRPCRFRLGRKRTR